MPDRRIFGLTPPPPKVSKVFKTGSLGLDLVREGTTGGGVGWGSVEEQFVKFWVPDFGIPTALAHAGAGIVFGEESFFVVR